MCPHSYFMEYVLGWKGRAGLAAAKGTITHKVLELFAIAQKCKQDGVSTFQDEILGNVNLDDFNATTIEDLTQTVYDFYSAAESHHKWQPKDYRECVRWVHKAVNHNGGMFDPRKRNIVEPEKHFDFEIEDDWAKYHFDNNGETISGRLGMKGTIDLITEVEPGFFEMIDWKGLPLDAIIPTPFGWSTMQEIAVGDIVFDQNGNHCNVVGKSKIKYNKRCYRVHFNDGTKAVCDNEHLWKLIDGSVVPIKELKVGDKIKFTVKLQCDHPEIQNAHKKCVGMHIINGGDLKTRTVTLIEKIGLDRTQCIAVDSPDNTYLCTEHFIATHNTGSRKDWATGEEKDYEKLSKDPQLRIYHYAATKMFPNLEHMMITIYFIKDGGPFSMYFGPKDIEDTKQMIRDKFEYIRDTKFPELKKGWKCQKFCYFGLNKFDDPMTETRWGQFTKIGEPMTMCQQIEYMNSKYGVDHTMKHMTKDGHKIGYYKAPGSTE